MEMCREKMYTSIDENGLNHKETVKVSQELDQEVLEEMLKDPKIKVIYQEQIIKAKDIRIAKLEEIIRNLRVTRRVNDLSELAAMLNETGMPAKESVKLSVYIGQVKGI